MIEFFLGAPVEAGGALVWAQEPQWVALAALVAVLAWAGAWATGRSSSRSRLVELACWALALGVLVVGLARPTWVTERGDLVSGRRVVLLDASASMDVREGDRPRSEGLAERARRMLPGAEVFWFGDELAGNREAAGTGTNLGVALSSLADRMLGQELQCIAVFTDGIDKGSLRREILESAEARPPALPGPLTVVQVGDARSVHDTAVVDLDSGGFAFLRTPLSLTARLRGTPGETLPATLSRDGKLVTTEHVQLDAAGEGTARFTVTPAEVGRFAWEVSVPVAPDDPVPGNNTAAVVVRVVRDRVRVMQVSGSPSYDQKFLRLFLKEDPGIDLVSFFILRTLDDFGAGWDQDELSLIAFPYERLFTEDLGTFDLVILQNFDYEPYFSWNSTELLANLAQYVHEGGALVMTGGDRSFDLGGYAGTPLAEILPVELGIEGPASADLAPFRPMLTPAGQVHPITRLAADSEESLTVWQRLPEMDGFNRTVGLVEGAAVLLHHPTARTDGGDRAPVLAIREVGEGRTMALMVDASWRWSFDEAAQGRGNQAYLRFWKNAMRWLVADPEDRRIAVAPDRENVVLGDAVRLGVTVRDTGHRPVEGARVSLDVTTTSGVRTELELMTDAQGEAVTEFRAEASGAHRVRARSERAGAAVGETVFAVSTRQPELDEIVPDETFLRTLAERAGGAYRGPQDDTPPVCDESASRPVAGRTEVDLAAPPVLALAFGLFASVGWWSRRRGGAR